jgi:energy-coupling factor transporter ATP-binding protein EcfA2
MLLRFRVANHRSIRDQQELSLVAVPRHSEPELAGDSPVPAAVRVAAIYGPNASGKSSVVSAINYLTYLVEHSYHGWGPTDIIPRQPFLLNARSCDEPSTFEIDFSIDDIRFNFGCELDSKVVISEWLYSYPFGKKRVLYERTEGQEFYFGRTLRGENTTTAKLTRPNALFLSVAAATSHDYLTEIYRFLTDQIVYADSSHEQEVARLMWLRHHLEDAEFAQDVGDMLRLADLGLTGIEVVPDEMSFRATADSDSSIHIEVGGGDSRGFGGPPKELFGQLQKMLGARLKSGSKIELLHESVDPNQRFRVPLTQESAGTKSWLSLIGRILFALRYGEVLIVDEIDASLHPRLSATLITIFKDAKQFNPNGAQLIFTTHDVSFLGALLDEDLLSRDEVWFTEKDHEGTTSLYSLVDFKPRKAENIERGYLQGRYGALPIVDMDHVKRVVTRVTRPNTPDRSRQRRRRGTTHVHS